MAIDIEALKKAAGGSEGDKVTWYATQLRPQIAPAKFSHYWNRSQRLNFPIIGKIFGNPAGLANFQSILRLK